MTDVFKGMPNLEHLHLSHWNEKFKMQPALKDTELYLNKMLDNVPKLKSLILTDPGYFVVRAVTIKNISEKLKHLENKIERRF